MEGMMKAAVLHGIGDLRVENVPIPKVEEDEVLVRIHRCGVCGSDIPRVFVKGTYNFPCIPGHEFAGQVVESADPALVGMRVAVFPLLPCFDCEPCKLEEYAQCENYDYYGSRRDGAFAEYLAVKKWNLIPIPENITYDEAAMCEPCAVAMHALNRAGVKEGDRVVIMGAGPIGLMLAQVARMMGAGSVALSDIDPDKKDFARKLGFDVLEEGENCADVVIEGTGASPALTRCLEIAARGGTVLCMGNPSREMTMSQKTYWHILRKELSVKGTWNSRYASFQNDWQDAIRVLSEGKLQAQELITHRVKLDDAPEMLAKMRDRSEFYVKLMIDLE